MKADTISKINSIILQIQGKFNDLSPFMSVITDLIASDIDRNFAEQGRWNGDVYPNITALSSGNQSWTPLKASTLYSYAHQKEQRPNSMILWRSGLLKDSIEVFASGKTGIGMSANTDYAEFLQLGTIHMPPRPYLVVSQECINEIIDFLARHI